MVDLQAQTGEQRIGMYVRISILLFILFLFFAAYLFIVPSVFPHFVAENIVEPRVVLRAYYASEDRELTNKLRKRFIRYSGENTARMALEGLDYPDVERRVKSMQLLYVSNREMCYEPLIAIYRDQTRDDEERYTALRVLNHIGHLDAVDRMRLVNEDMLKSVRWSQLAYDNIQAHGVSDTLKAALTERLFSVGNTLKESVEIAALVFEDPDQLVQIGKKLLTLHDLPLQRAYYYNLIKAFNKEPEQILTKYLAQHGFERELWIELISLEFHELEEPTQRAVLKHHVQLSERMVIDLLANWHFSYVKENVNVVYNLFESYHEELVAQAPRHNNYARLFRIMSNTSYVKSLDRNWLFKQHEFYKKCYLLSIFQSNDPQEIMDLAQHMKLLLRLLGNRKPHGHLLLDNSVIRLLKQPGELDTLELLGIGQYANKRFPAFQKQVFPLVLEKMLFDKATHRSVRYYNELTLKEWLPHAISNEAESVLNACISAMKAPLDQQAMRLMRVHIPRLMATAEGRTFIDVLKQRLQLRSNGAPALKLLQQIKP